MFGIDDKRVLSLSELSRGDAKQKLTINIFCARMTIKPISGGQTGPLELKVDSSKIDIYTEQGNLRLQFL